MRIQQVLQLLALDWLNPVPDRPSGEALFDAESSGLGKFSIFVTTSYHLRFQLAGLAIPVLCCITALEA